MDSLFKSEAKKIQLCFAKETVEDPFEKNVSLQFTNTVSIDALISDLTPAQAQWKIPGVMVNKVKDIIIEKKHLSKLEVSAKIKINKEYYEGWRVNGKMQYREEGDYLRVYVYIKKAE